MAKKYYAVREGRNPGIYDNWADCKAQVHGCPNEFRAFDTYDEAAYYYATGLTSKDFNGRALFAAWKRTQPSIKTSPKIAKEEKKPLIPNYEIEAFDASQSFFSQVPNFEPDDKADFDNEFSRFASSQNIIPGSQDWQQKRTKAISHEMIYHYSQRDITEEDELDLGLPEEEKLQFYRDECREADKVVNIINYINAKRNPRPNIDYEERHVDDVEEESSTAPEIPEHDHKVISIHGIDSECSSSPQPIEEEEGEGFVDDYPWSCSITMGSPDYEIPINNQRGTKRNLHDLMKDQDVFEDEVINKRFRI